MRAVQIPSESLNFDYDDACWQALSEMPIDDWADFSNMFDGCAFE